MKTLLGGKGANCAEMAKVGLSVPPGFTITTAVREKFNEVKLNFKMLIACCADLCRV